MQKIKIFLISLFLFFTLIHPTYAADVEQFGISLDCYPTCQDKNSVDYSKDIIFALSIKNNLDYWISIGGEKEWSGADFRITTENINLQNGKGGELYNEVLGHRFFIEPNSELKIYIPFNLFNELSKENRLGDWTIFPELSFSTQDAFIYKDPFETKTRERVMDNQLISSTIRGNALKFSVMKPEVEISDQMVQMNVKIDRFLNNRLIYVLALFLLSVISYILRRRIYHLLFERKDHKADDLKEKLEKLYTPLINNNIFWNATPDSLHRLWNVAPRSESEDSRIAKEFLNIYKKYSYLASKDLEPILKEFDEFIKGTMSKEEFEVFKQKFKEALLKDSKKYREKLK